MQAEASAAGALRLVQGDILDQEIAELMAPPYEVVANVPYHITSPILHRFLGARAAAGALVLMLQREVAERISAAPGEMSYLSVFVQYHAAVRVAFVVPRDAFEPAPEVESAVVEIVPVDPPASVRASRRGGGRSLAGRPGRLPRAAQEAAQRAGRASCRCRAGAWTRLWRRPASTGDRRPQTLSVGEWLALRAALGPLPRRTSPAEAAAKAGPSGAGPPPRGEKAVDERRGLRRARPAPRRAPSRRPS